VAAKLKSLPAYHPTVAALLTVSTESPSAVEEFESVFRADPAFASELLQVANSAEMGLRHEVENIRHALTLLGLERVNSLAFTLAMRFYVHRAANMRDVHVVWSHSVASGIVAEVLAEACEVNSPGIYTAGLIHDVGRLGLMMIEGPQYLRFTSQEFPDVGEYLANEQQELAVMHTEAGAVMAENWGFPQPLCDCIRQHHEPFGSPPVGAVALVGCACRLASALGYGEIRYHDPETPEAVLAELPATLRVRPQLQPFSLQQTIAKTLGGVWRW
jgi:putative nucleotidyltransferase with HDIG domain